MSGDLFSRRKMKQNARKAADGDGGDGWTWAGLLLVLAVIATALRNCSK